MGIAGAIINSDHNFWPGQLALVRVRGRGESLVRIIKRNPKNYKAELPDGSQISGPHMAFRPAPADAKFESTVVKPELSFLKKGTVVRIKPTSGWYRHAGDALYVITSQTREMTHNAYPLGGGNRYLPKVTSADVDVVPVEDTGL